MRPSSRGVSARICIYRLNVFPVQMPPLRERLEDLPVLIEHLVQRQGQVAGRHIRLDKEAMNCLARNRWPGNVRELSNLLERLAILFPEQTITRRRSARALSQPAPRGGSAAACRIGVRAIGGRQIEAREDRSQSPVRRADATGIVAELQAS